MDTAQVFGQVGQVTITVLVDNRADLIVTSTERVKYSDAALWAEHGFAALIELPEQGRTILWDSGASGTALLENMRRLELDPRRVDAIAVSHGHWDHTGGMSVLLRAMALAPGRKEWPAATPIEELARYAEGRRVPLVAHPGVFHELWGQREDGRLVGPTAPPPRAEWEALGAEVMLSEGPHRLAPGCWFTGYVPRRSYESAGRGTGSGGRRLYREGQALLPDDIADDAAIALNVRGKGLVVLSGCAHAGIVNTIERAREISGVERVHAVLGGFHLARAEPEEVERTIAAIAALSPALVAPTHCTGAEAIERFRAAMPDRFARGLVGARYLF
jgi:7,8-dihydropterin-6-yl-methyl-4-(beta-D-ribofuranosyl)aminobenzene 5'-phosphate synthase